MCGRGQFGVHSNCQTTGVRGRYRERKYACICEARSPNHTLVLSPLLLCYRIYRALAVLNDYALYRSTHSLTRYRGIREGAVPIPVITVVISQNIPHVTAVFPRITAVISPP